MAPPPQIQSGFTGKQNGFTGQNSRGLVRVLSPDDVTNRELQNQAVAAPVDDDPSILEVAKHIRYRMYEMRNFRNMMGIGQRLIDALRTYKGEYDPKKLGEIRQFGGSTVFARVTPAKCRGATSLLRDIYLGSERPWDISPHPHPEIPEQIEGNIQALVASEIAQAGHAALIAQQAHQAAVQAAPGMMQMHQQGLQETQQLMQIAQQAQPPVDPAANPDAHMQINQQIQEHQQALQNVQNASARDPQSAMELQGQGIQHQQAIQQLHRTLAGGHPPQVHAALAQMAQHHRDSVNQLQQQQAANPSPQAAPQIQAQAGLHQQMLAQIQLVAQQSPDALTQLQTSVQLHQDAMQQLMQFMQMPQPPSMLPTEDQISDRVEQLRDAAEKAAKKKAFDEAKKAKSELETILEEGGFYRAFAEFLIDLPIFPFAAIKGPTVRMHTGVKWVNGQAQRVTTPKLFWSRVSPFDLYWTPTAHCPHEAEFIERLRLTRSDLLACKGLPGYNDNAIAMVLDRFHDRGFREWWDVVDVERALLENREAWPRTSSSLIDTAEYHGTLSGKTLLEWGMDASQISDPQQEYKVTAWLIDRFVIKAQLDPTPSQTPPYYITQFEKIPGTMYGYGLPDLLDDTQQVANATMRSIVNNMGIASGPQVVINDQVLQPGESDDMYPWKRWHVKYDPMLSNAQAPITFFQPDSRVQELQGLYTGLSQMADEVSAIPRYETGGQAGGVGRTASGLSMLLANAAKTLQNVAASIDRDIWDPALSHLYELVMLAMPGIFRGDETVDVKGVSYAVKREQDRTRQLEFLNMTSNPTDIAIVGVEGRANILRSVAGSIGLDQDKIVPDDAQFEAQQQAQQQLTAAQGATQQAGAMAQRAMSLAQKLAPRPVRAQEAAQEAGQAAQSASQAVQGAQGATSKVVAGNQQGEQLLQGNNIQGQSPGTQPSPTIAQQTGVQQASTNMASGRPGG